MSQTSSSTSPKSPKRPVACLHCHHKKVKCSGVRPCQRCNKKGIPCQEYESKRKRSQEEEPQEPKKQKTVTEEKSNLDVVSLPAEPFIFGNTPEYEEDFTSKELTPLYEDLPASFYYPSLCSSDYIVDEPAMYVPLEDNYFQ